MVSVARETVAVETEVEAHTHSGGALSSNHDERAPNERVTGADLLPPEPVSLGTVLAIIGTPLVLILMATVASVTLTAGPVLSFFEFVGSPFVALTVALLLAFYVLGIRRGWHQDEIGRVMSAALKPVGMILLVVGAGGFFGAVLQGTGVGAAVAKSLTGAGLPPIALGYLISAGLRIAQGSATVAIIATAGIVGPLVVAGGFSQAQTALLVIAISAGSIMASHVNDGGFWIVSRYFGIPVKETLQTWTVLETILSLAGFVVAAALSLIL
jgi:GntP family gluconate:H+ symporter